MKAHGHRAQADAGSESEGPSGSHPSQSWSVSLLRGMHLPTGPSGGVCLCGLTGHGRWPSLLFWVAWQACHSLHTTVQAQQTPQPCQELWVPRLVLKAEKILELMVLSSPEPWTPAACGVPTPSVACEPTAWHHPEPPTLRTQLPRPAEPLTLHSQALPVAPGGLVFGRHGRHPPGPQPCTDQLQTPARAWAHRTW